MTSRMSRTGRAWLTLIVLAAAAAFAAPASAATDPPQGWYDSCPQVAGETWASCEEVLAQMRGGGFDHVLNYGASGWQDLTTLRAYGDAAQRQGIGVIWNVDYRSFGPGAAGHERAREMVVALRGHPATLGWYLADEPPSEDRPTVNAWGEQVRALDPAHDTYVVGIGNNAAGCEHSMRGMTDAAGVTALGCDTYPIGTPAHAWGESPRAVGPVIREVALHAGHKNQWAVLQNFPWSEVWPCAPSGTACWWARDVDRWPTLEELEVMEDCAREAGAETITWFHHGTIRAEAAERGLNWRTWQPWADAKAARSTPYVDRGCVEGEEPTPPEPSPEPAGPAPSPVVHAPTPPVAAPVVSCGQHRGLRFTVKRGTVGRVRVYVDGELRRTARLRFRRATVTFGRLNLAGEGDTARLRIGARVRRGGRVVTLRWRGVVGRCGGRIVVDR